MTVTKITLWNESTENERELILRSRESLHCSKRLASILAMAGRMGFSVIDISEYENLRSLLVWEGWNSGSDDFAAYLANRRQHRVYNSMEVTARFNHEKSDKSYVNYRFFKAPFPLSDAEIVWYVEESMPASRCHHDYDCCGQYYPGKAAWFRLNEREFTARQSFNRNI